MNTYRYMCADPERAEQNREMVSKKLYIKAYIQVEAWLAGYNISDLPYWMYEKGLVADKAKRKRFKNLTPERRSEIARNAANKRWDNPS